MPDAPRRPLVANRPMSLEQRYVLLDANDTTDTVDAVFARLQAQLFGAIERRRMRGGETIFREAGRLAPGRPYFYIKPGNERGLLFERSGAGWLVTPAEKIVARDLFMREAAPIDSVSLYAAPTPGAPPRVRAYSSGDALVALTVYQSRVLQQLALT